MHDDAKHISDPRPASRLRRAGPVIAGLIATGLLVMACGEGSSTSTPGQPASSGSKKAGALAYSKCMRSHGVAAFPDPNSKGEISLNATPENGLDFESPTMKSAMQACKSLEPVGTAAEQRENQAQGLKFAQCMRSHGVPTFPDPKAGGGMHTEEQSGRETQGSQGVDPDSPQFKAAEQACRSLAPGGEGPSLQSGGGS